MMRKRRPIKGKGVEIWCSLREPAPFKAMLEQMEEVAQVSGPLRNSTDGPEHQPVLDVRLESGIPGESLAPGGSEIQRMVPSIPEE